MLVAQLYQTLCDPTNCSPPGSSVHGILQARRLERMSFLPPEDLPDPGIKQTLVSCTSGRFFPILQGTYMYRHIYVCYALYVVYIHVHIHMGLPGGAMIKNLCQCRRCKRLMFSPWVGKIPWSKKWHPTTPLFLPGKFHGPRSLVGYVNCGYNSVFV